MHRRRKLPENGVVIVLGARVVGASKTCPAHLSRAFQYRVDTAASYLKAYPKAVCITTGGQGKDEPQSEGEAAKEALMKFGVAPKRIFAEVNSKTTLENLRFARDILRENGFSDTVLLATQSYHQWRAAAWQKCWNLRRIRCMRRPI